jgi:uncharacterized protein DUF4340
MKSSYLTNLILVCVIATLFWFSRQTTTPDITNHSFEYIDVHTINNIQLKRENRDDIKLHRQDANWKIVQPINAAANTTRINLLLSLLGTSSHSQLDHASDETLKQLGLNPIKLSLQLNEHLFIFGDREPLNKYRYVLHQNTVYLLDDTITPLLNASASSFINNRLIAKQYNINSMQLPLFDGKQLSATNTIYLELNNSHWQSLPVIDSTDKLTMLIDFWQQSEAMQVSPVTEDDMASLANIQVIINFEESSTPATFLIQLTARNLFIIDLNKKLKYQFPAAMAQQLFIDKESN